MNALKNELDEARKARIVGVIELFKVFVAGRASTGGECIEWAKRVGWMEQNLSVQEDAISNQNYST